MTLTLQLNPFYTGTGTEIRHRNTIYASNISLIKLDAELSNIAAWTYPTLVSAGDAVGLPGFVNLLEITSDDPGELLKCVARPFRLEYRGLQIFPIGSSLVLSEFDSLYLWFIAKRRPGPGALTVAAVNLVITISTEDEEPIVGATPEPVPTITGTAP